TWLFGIFRGDLGRSIVNGTPIFEELIRRLPVTIELMILSILIGLIIAIPAGIISAVRQDTIIDYVVRFISIGGLSVPTFWSGTLLLILPLLWFRYLPPMRYVSFFENPWANLQLYMWPSLAIGFALSASVMRMTRTMLLEVLRQDYIRTAQAKGLREAVLIRRHALKNAMIPVVTIIGLQIGRLMGGTVIMERIFQLPGIGRFLLDAIAQRDYPELQTIILLITAMYVLLNLLVDITYAWLDPRIRYG
ncbi:MAG: ABC transporter permease, partial [Candidatus Tectomicrobia bacterium]|nr:ABC transporter permease [Candidatus Tectomicrobia bacterium]